MRNEIVEAKIQMPRVPNKSIIRERLLEQFLIDDYRLLVLHATVGYGKTVLISHFVVKTNAEAAWYHLYQNDNDVVTFMQYLTTSIKRVRSEFSFDINAYDGIETGESSIESMVFDFVAYLTAAQKSHDSELYIILDDFQVITNEKINYIVETILKNTDHNIKIIVATKGLIPVFWGKFFIEGTAKIIDQDELGFTLDEVREMLRRNGIAPDKDNVDSEKIFEVVEGWPAGVMFEILYMKQARGKYYTKTNEKTAINDYIMRELFRTLPFDIQQFLTVTSALDYLSPGVCNVVLKIPNSASFLDYLVQENLFITKVGETSQLYRYHSLFKDFLNTQLKQEKKHEVMQLATDYYLRTDNKEQAVEYAITGDNTDLMQSAMGSVAMKLIDQGKLQTVERWIGWLEQKAAVLTPMTMMICGVYNYKCGKSTQAIKFIERASELFMNAGDEPGYISNMIEKARIVRSISSPEKSNLIILDLMPLIQKKYKNLRITAISEQLYNYIFSARFEEALQLCRSMISEARNSADEKNAAHFLKFLIIIHFYIGNYSEAFEIYEEFESDEDNEKSIGSFTTNAYIAVIYALRGSFIPAIEKIESEINRKIEANQQDDLWLLYLLNAIIELITDLAESEDSNSFRQSTHWKKASQLVRLSERRMVYLPEDHVYREFLEAVKTLITERDYENYSDEQIETILGLAAKSHPFVRDMQASIITYRLYKNNQLARAERVIRQIINDGGEMNVMRIHTMSILALIVRERDYEEAYTLINTAYEYSRLNRISLNFLEKDDRAIVDGMLSSSMPVVQPGIRVNAFGEFSVYIIETGEEIKWRTRKAQELFAYLFDMSGEPVTRDKLLAILWPDASDKSATSLFHTTLYSIRKALNNNRINNLLLYDKKKYSIDMSLVKSDVSKLTLASEEMKNSGKISISEQELTDLYRGSYMEDIESEFALTQRGRYERLFLALCRHAADSYINNGQYESAIHICEKARQVNSIEEKIYLELIRAYALAGDIKNARDVYEAMKEMIKIEFGSEPNEETETKAERYLASGSV